MWSVQLTGDRYDLAAIARSFSGSDINITHDGQEYLLTSKRFASLQEAGEVRRDAEEIVRILNGASRIALDVTESIRVGAVYRSKEDGKRATFVFAEPAVIRFRVIAPTVTLTRADGTVEEFQPADPVRK